MDYDNKYDQSFRKSELAVKEENEKVEEEEENETDDDSDKVVEAMKAMDDYFTREPHDFGGNGNYIY